MLGTIPKTFSNDTLDLSSVDSMSLDEHIEIKIPESRLIENRKLAQNNFVQHINEKSRNPSHSHLAVENGEFPRIPLEMPKNVAEVNMPRNHLPGVGDSKGSELKEHGHIHRSHSHASVKSMKRGHGLTPNGVCPAANGHDHRVDDKNRIKK